MPYVAKDTAEQSKSDYGDCEYLDFPDFKYY